MNSGWVERLRSEFSFIRGNVLILFVSWILIGFAMYMPLTYYSLYVLELGGTPFTVGVIGFAHSLSLMSVQFLGGYFADSYGRRKLVVMMTFALAGSYILYALAPTWKILLVASVIEGLSLVYMPALRAILADSLPPEKRGLGYSISVLVFAPSMASPFVAAWFVERMGMLRGMRLIYLASSVIYFLAAVLRIRLRETLRERRYRPLDALKSYPRAFREGFRVWSSVPRETLWLSIIYVASFSVTWLCSPYYVIYATDELGVDETFWALLVAIQNAASYVFSIPLGKLVDAVGRVKPLVASMALLSAAVSLFITGRIVFLPIAFTLLGTSSVLFSTSYQSLQTDLVSAEYRGRVIGFTYFFAYMCQAFTQLVGGYVYESFSPRLPFILLASSQIPLIALALATLSKAEKVASY